MIPTVIFAVALVVVLALMSFWSGLHITAVLWSGQRDPHLREVVAPVMLTLVTPLLCGWFIWWLLGTLP